MSNPIEAVNGLMSPFAVTTLSDNDRQKILYEFTDTKWSYPERETLLSLFEEQVLLHPERVAVSYLGQQLTYRELEEKSNQLAHYLSANGVKPGMLVPIWLDRCKEWVVAIIAVLKTGAAYVPVDPAYPLKRAAYIFSDTEAVMIITNKARGALLEAETDAALLYAEEFGNITQMPVYRPDIDISDSDVAYVIYTSGSTGKPKGVVVRQQAIQHLISWHNKKFAVSSTSRLSLVAGLAFDISIWETWSALAAGAALFIATDEERTSVAGLGDWYLRNKLTHAFVPAVMAPEMVTYTRQLNGLALQYLFTGGEQLKPVLTAGLSYQLIDYYGPTECTVFVTYKKVKEENGQFISTIGKPVANTRAYILGDNQEMLPIGAIGELCIGGVALSAGYLHNEELTSRKFIPDPFLPGEKIYLTGDQARWLPDGNIQFLGRMDNQVKIRGFRVELGEIERTLMSVPGIKNATVITKDNAGNNKYLVAFITEETGNIAVNIPEIRQRLRQDLPGYMIPAQIIPLKEMPLTENGKTDRARLAAIATEHLQDIRVAEPPTNDTERAIADIWSDALGRPGINITDNFFDIGGDSLLVAVVAVRLMDKLGIKVYLRDIYQYPVLQQLSDAMIARAKEVAVLPEEDMEPFVELENDVYLAPGTVFAGGFDPGVLKNPAALLLTGVTGFVGIHLLEELLQSTSANIYCLIRAQDEFHAMEKIDRCAAKFNVSGIAAFRKRIIPVIGDLSKPSLGLDEEMFGFLSNAIDVIYHSGSSVNFIEPYSYMKAPNVDGLREIIRLAGAGRTKCLALMSTISVYSWGHVFTNKTVMLETDDIKQNLLAVSKDIGYVRSKWVMEAIADLAASKGLPLITYRLGYAMCHSRTGASAPYQWWSGLVKNCIEFKSFPQLTELREGLITVDYMAKAVAHITKNAAAIGKKFNLIARPETNLTLEDFFALIKKYYPFTLNGIPYKEWRKQWEDDSRNRLFPLTSLFKDNMHEGLSTVELYQHTYVWDCTHVTRFLEGSGIEEPVFDKQLLDNYLKYLKLLPENKSSI